VNIDLEKEKIVSIEDRIPKLKQQRKQKANRRFILFILTFSLLILLIIYLETPLSKVKNVEVSGNVNVPSDEIISLSGIDQQTNFWSVNKEKTIKALKKHKEVKGANIVKIFPHTIRIEIEEMKRVAYVSNGSSFYPVLENGETLDGQKSVKVPDAPILFGFDDAEFAHLMTEQLTNLPHSISNSISEVHYTPEKMDPYIITLFMNNGYEVRASMKTFAEKMRSYPMIVKELNPKVKGIIHLEVGSYFEPYSKKGSQKNKGDKADEES
jgi:cell division protein FtsQ